MALPIATQIFEFL